MEVFLMLDVTILIGKVALTMYLGSVVISGTTESLIVWVAYKRLRREGFKYKGTEEKKSFIEKAVSFLSIAHRWLVPFKNILMTKKMLEIAESSYTDVKENMLAENKLEKIEQQETKEIKTEKIDHYISDIQKDILEIANIKYEGFEKDIETLHQLALDFLEARKDSTEYSILSSSNKWWRPVIDIEFKLEEKRKQQNGKDANRELLEQTMEYLKKQKIYTFQHAEEIVEPMDSERTRK